MSISDLEKILKSWDFESYRARQIHKELYVNRSENFLDMQTLPIALRTKLYEEYEINTLKAIKIRKSQDGSVKFLFELHDKKSIEAVYMPWYDDEDGNIERVTLCISSMAGCPVACSFCATGTMGLLRNLETAEIVEQILFVEKHLDTKITNIVFMGMGEPLLNYYDVTKAIEILADPENKLLSRRKITLSTVGIANKILKLAKFIYPVKLAISLHATTNGFRNKIIPLSKNIDLASLMDAVEYYYRQTKMPITYEYIPFEGMNDTDDDAKRLARFCKRVPSRVNLIPFNDISFTNVGDVTSTLKPTSKDKILEFGERIKFYGGRVTIRDTFGTDIEAACGQLALSEG